MGHVWSAVRAFHGVLHREPVRQGTKQRRLTADRPPVPQPSSWLEKGELPEVYDRTKVVAMAVSPYLVHVYWDLAVEHRAETAPASLRFRDAAGNSFDVAINLPAKNWYVHLWSPEKRYYAELGLHRGEEFVSLARSNTIETPRAWPAAEVTEHVAAASAVAQPQRSAVTAPDVSARPVPAVTPPVPVSPLASPPPPPNPQTPEVARSFASMPGPEPPPRPALPVNAMEVLRKRLSELYLFRHWQLRPAAVPEAVAAEAATPSLLHAQHQAAPIDLTAWVEAQFSPGFSSVQLGLAAPKKPAV